MRYLCYLCAVMFLTFGLAWGQQKNGFVYEDKGRRDPFVELVDHEGNFLFQSKEGQSFSLGELKVSGILWDSQGNSTALINNQIVGVGETICGFVVTSITKDNIKVSKDGQEHIIWFSIEELTEKGGNECR